jgi:hypothetical protein
MPKEAEGDTGDFSLDPRLGKIEVDESIYEALISRWNIEDPNTIQRPMPGRDHLSSRPHHKTRISV